MPSPHVAVSQDSGELLAASGFQLLSELQSAHHELLVCVALMEEVTASAAPDPVRLTGARLKISQASLARRVVWRKIQEFLLCRVQRSDALTLRDLTERDLQQFQRSSAHVARWTGAAAMADWPGYQAASKAIRGHIVANIRCDMTLLHPLLYRYR